jgi:nicotinate-nucleotide adenylyltransferase
VNIALFGGTFDPIHIGHLRAANVATQRFHLDRVLFVPTGTPPHKYHDRLTPFADRFAMVTLACAANRRFVPSLLEAPRNRRRPHYSIATVRALKRSLRAKDRLYFLIGADAFLDLPHWKDYRHLLSLVNFLIVSRPGFDPRKVWSVLPRKPLGSDRRNANPSEIRFGKSTLHVLRGVNETVASREIREAVRNGRSVAGLVPPLVEEYIVKEGLYRSAHAGRRR